MACIGVPSSPTTEASVWVEMTGEGGTSSGERHLAADEAGDGMFKPGHVDEFTVTCLDLGNIVQIRVRTSPALLDMIFSPGLPV